MTLLRTSALLITALSTLAFMPAASAQISLGSDYRAAYDEARDGFGEDYDSQKREAELARQNGRSISSEAGAYISQSTSAAKAGDYEKTLAQANKGLSISSLTPYEKSVLYQLHAAANIKLGNYSQASESYNYAIETNGMNEEETTKIQATLAKLKAAGVK